MLSILQTELFQVCSCLGNLHAVEPSLQPELLNHLLHSGDAGGTRHGEFEGRADSSVRGSAGRGSAGPDDWAARSGGGAPNFVSKFPVLSWVTQPSVRMRAALRLWF